MEIDKKTRLRCEERVYRVMDIIDPSGTNSEYYKKLFAKLSDAQFYKLMKQKFPYKFHATPMVIEPTVEQCDEALKKELNSSLVENITLPYFYKNADGVPISGREQAYVVYIHLPKVQQMIVKKNKNAMDINNRDMKGGRLNSDDKGAATSDRELESLITLGFDATAHEFGTFRADAMDAKNVAYNTINVKGLLSAEDVPVDIDDSLSKNMMSTYMIGALLNSNIVNQGNYTPYTLKNKQRKLERE